MSSKHVHLPYLAVKSVPAVFLDRINGLNLFHLEVSCRSFTPALCDHMRLPQEQGLHTAETGRGGRVANLLGSPFLCWVVGHSFVDDFSRVVFDDDESEDLTEERVVGLHKVTGPDFVRVILQECRPGLAAGRGALARHTHVLLDRPLGHGNAQLEQLPANPLSSPPAPLPGKRW